MKKILALLVITGISTSCFGFNISIKHDAKGMPKRARTSRGRYMGGPGWKVKLASSGNKWITSWKNMPNEGNSVTFKMQTKGRNKGKLLPSNFVIQIQSRGKYRAMARATKYLKLRIDVTGVTSNKTYTIKKRAIRSGENVRAIDRQLDKEVAEGFVFYVE